MVETERAAKTAGRAASALLDRGIALGKSNRTEDAIEIYKETVAMYGVWKEPEVAVPVAWALNNMGNALDRLHRPEEAIQSYEQSLAMYGQRTEEEFALPVAQTLFNMGLTIGELNRPSDAIKTYDAIVDRFGERKEPGPALIVARALYNKGVALGAMNRTEEAIASYSEVARMFGDRPEIELAVQVAWALVDEGVALNRLNRPQDAIEAYEKAKTRYANRREEEFAAPLSQALVNKGNALKRLNRPEESLQSYQEAVDKYGDRNEVAVAGPVGDALINKGIWLVEADRDAEALPVFREILERYGNRREEEFETRLVKALINMCSVLNKLNRRGEAARIFKEVVAKFDHPVKLAHAPENLGRWAENCLKTPDSPDNVETAFILTQTALDLVTPDSVLYPKLRHFHAMALRWKDVAAEDVPGVRKEAAAIEREAWELSYARAPREALFMARQWADWAWDHEIWDEAAEGCSLGNRALGKIFRGHLDQSERLELLGHFRFATRGAYAFAKLGKAPDAIVLLERASDFLFSGDRQERDMTRLSQIRPDLSDRLTSALLAADLAHQKHGFDAFGQLSAEELEARAEADHIVIDVRKIDGFASFSLPSGWQDVREAAAGIPLFYIVPTEKGCACFLVGFAGGENKNIQIMDAPITHADFVATARPFIDAEFGEGGGDKHTALLELLEWLGSRIMIHVKKEFQDAGRADQPFAIIPFGFAANLPLHAACMSWENPPRRQILFHPRNVSYAYSARNLVESQKRSGEGPASPALVINNPRPLPATFDALQLSDVEVAVVASHFSTTELAGFQATPKAVLEALNDKSIVHFGCHGSVDSRLGYSGVLFLGNGELTYRDLHQVPRFSPRLVVLSACRSGASAVTVEQVINLPGAFLASGAAGVVGALWHSDEMASVLLVGKFYELWSDGAHSPVQALGDAQAWLMSATADELRASLKPEILRRDAAEVLRNAPGEETVYFHPWYWCGFFLAGA